MKFLKHIPGIILSAVIAFLACWIENILPIHLIGSAVIAMFIGMFLNHYLHNTTLFSDGLKFTSKKILKFAIILLGLSLNITTILHVGKMSLTVMIFTLLTCFGGGYFIGKALGLNWKLSNLISAGTGICGGSAIAAIAPTIDADDNDVAYAMSATFLFDMAMIVLFPIMGRALGMTDQAFGIWAGTAVNDTSSVVATGYGFSEGAGDFATMVKLTRTIAIIPTVLVFAYIGTRIKQKELKAIRAEVSEIPDLVPVMCVVAALAEGTTVFESAGRLRIKESDRIKSVVEMLCSVGGKVEETDDGMIIHGSNSLNGGVVNGYNDHRIVMSASVLSSLCKEEVTITDSNAVEKSYPDFWDCFNKMGGKSDVLNDR